MKRIEIPEAMNCLRLIGRPYFDRQGKTLFFNWSASGFEIMFRGSMLTAEAVAIASTEIEEFPGDENSPTHLTWPRITVFADGERIDNFEISKTSQQILLFKAEDEDSERIHTVRILKATENAKTKFGIRSFSTDGEVIGFDAAAGSCKRRRRVEFIGDSITCAYGINGPADSTIFWSDEEDATLGFGVMAAEALDMDCSLVSVSGISVEANPTLSRLPYGMEDLYRYTDRFIEDILGKTYYEEFDFKRFHNDVVVINLGTNDGNSVAIDKDPWEKLSKFKERYIKFIEEVRKLNGPDTYIICSLGTMGYFLYPEICEAVASYRASTHDERISTYRYMQISPLDGFGTGLHPNCVTNRKMAEEIEAEIRRILGL